MTDKSNYWQRQVSRRGVLRGAALGGAGLAAAALAGCGDDDEPAAPSAATATTPSAPAATAGASATPAAEQPKRGGKLAFQAPLGGFRGFDPHLTGQSESGYMNLFYQGLVRANAKTLEAEPSLAQSWEQPSQTEYVFKMPPNAKWHNKPPVNGRAVTAEDVVFNLKRVGTEQPQFLNRSRVASIAQVEAMDGSTVKITTKQPDALLLHDLSEVTILMLAPEAVDKAGGNVKTADLAIGTGPFVIQSHSDTGDSFVRNQEYWKSGLPYLDGIDLVRIDNDQTAWAGFLAGQIDVGYVPGSEAKKFMAEQAKNYTADWLRDFSIHNLWPNTQKPPFNDPRVYRALRLLTDHSEAITGWAEVWAGQGAFVSHINNLVNAWDFTQDEYGRMLEWKQPKDEAAREALALLSAAGFNKDNPLKFNQLETNAGPFLQAEAELLQAQYRRLSQGAVETELQLLDNPTLQTRLAQGEFEFAGPVSFGIYTDPDDCFQIIYRTGGSRNFGRWSDARADEMIAQERRTFDAGQRKTLVKDILRRLIENAPYVGFSARNQPVAAQAKVQGWSPEFRFNVWGFQYESVSLKG